MTMVNGLIVASCTDFDYAFPGQTDQLVRLLSKGGADVALHERIDGRFPDGEVVVTLPAIINHSTVVILQSLSSLGGQSHDAALLALLAAIRAYREYGAGRIVVFVPHLAYSRQDRRKAGELRPLTSLLISQLLSVAGADRVLSINAGAVERLTDVFSPLPLEFIQTDDFIGRRIEEVAPRAALVAPDAGATAQVRRLAQRFGRPWAAGRKVRVNATTVDLEISDCSLIAGSRHAVVIDDLICSAGTVLATANALKRLGIERIWVFAPHLRLTGQGTSRLKSLWDEGFLSGLYGTDSIPSDTRLPFEYRDPFMAEFGVQIAEEIQAERAPQFSVLGSI